MQKLRKLDRLSQKPFADIPYNLRLNIKKVVKRHDEDRKVVVTAYPKVKTEGKKTVSLPTFYKERNEYHYQVKKETVDRLGVK